VVVRPADLLRWSAWYPLVSATRVLTIPPAPGLYRIRRVGHDDLDYIGQTGMGTMTLRKRLGMLLGVYGELMPYRDPHTAGPALWALYHQTGETFEVSVVPIEDSTPWRKGLEAMAIALYRQEHGRSPTVEFGRMPAGYRASSSYNLRLLAAAQVYRGGPSEESDASHVSGIPPLGPLASDPQSSRWGGHDWSPWILLEELAAHRPQGSGLYRIRGWERGSLMYIGQGRIAPRLLAHPAKTRVHEHPQGRLFATSAPLECSWVLNDGWLSHQRLELENDLIASHLLATGAIPVAQFRG
jgi:hypothetical protein